MAVDHTWNDRSARAVVKDPNALLERVPDATQHRLLVRADRSLRQGGDLVRQLERSRERLSSGDDLVDQPDPLRLVGTYDKFSAVAARA